MKQDKLSRKGSYIWVAVLQNVEVLVLEQVPELGRALLRRTQLLGCLSVVFL